MESNDIVARLRKEIRKRDREYPVELLPELREAADEIERLREQLRLANIDNFNTTAEIERLRDELVRNADEFRETLTELRQRVKTITDERDVAQKMVTILNASVHHVTAERDEARREVSYLRPSVTLGAQTAVEYAKSRGWDCFKEER